jgi:hypothetical protein
MKTSIYNVARKAHSLVLVLAVLLLPGLAFAVGSWTPLVNYPSEGIGHMLLLSDGTVMAQGGGGLGTNWFRLTPDVHGSYVNGTWSTLAPMHDTRRYYSSDVLPDGRVFVAGGEYGTGFTNAEVFDPVANTWTSITVPTNLITQNTNVSTTPGSVGAHFGGFSDSFSVVLNNGKVLITPVYPYNLGATILFDPVSNQLSEGPHLPFGNIWADEQSAVRLPDDSILTYDFYQRGERYIPSLNTWIGDSSLPIQLFSGNQEVGAGFMLSDGRVFFLGGVGNTIYYTPTGNTNNGSWTIGPNIPNGLVAQDAPAAMMANGNILCAFTVSANHSTNYFYEFNPFSDIFIQTSGPNSPTTDTNYVISDATSMLDLPDGTVLYSNTGGQLYVYNPGSPQLAAGQPAINSIVFNTDASAHITGTLFNGISQGASFGDDNQMDSNYPLVRFSDGSGNVYYGRTYNWSSTSVQTGSRLVSTECVLPANVLAGPGGYTIQVVANGINSTPQSFGGPVWVDFNYAGSPKLGTYANPYSTLAQGTNAVPVGGYVVVKPGLSHETMTISKPMNISAVGGTAIIGQ